MINYFLGFFHRPQQIAQDASLLEKYIISHKFFFFFTLSFGRAPPVSFRVRVSCILTNERTVAVVSIHYAS